MAVVSTYQQAAEPTDLKPGTTWYRDDGTAWVRKLDLSWNYIGEWQLPNFHHLSVEGGTMLGPILGGHGLAPVENPAFMGTATLNDLDLADKQWTTEQLSTLQDTLTALISNQIGGTSGTITIGSNLAIGYGNVAHGGTIPLPVYADNKRAVLSEVWAVIPSVRYLQGHSDATTSFDWEITCSVDASLVVTCAYAGWAAAAASINYLVICKR